MWEQGYARAAQRTGNQQCWQLNLCRASLDWTAEGGCPHMVPSKLSAVLVLIETSENFLLGDQPIFVFVAWGVSTLLV